MIHSFFVFIEPDIEYEKKSLTVTAAATKIK
jgi:hypothetical protein